MSTSSSTALTRIETVPSTSPIANLLRQILAWMDSRNTVVIELPAPEPKAKIEDTDEDDGILKPIDIAEKVGALLWAHRSAIEVTLDYDEINPGKGRHSDYHPLTTVKLPGGIHVVMRRSTHYGGTVVVAPDDQSQEIPADIDGRIIGPWQCIKALAIIDTLGLDDLLPADIEDDGVHPSITLPDRLAQALGRYVEQRVPVQCTETYKVRRYIEETKHHPASHREDTLPSLWQSIGEDVLLRMEFPYSYGPRGEKKSQEPRAHISHPVFGTLTLPGKAIQSGLERRTSTSLAQALGMALELPAHLPMPRGNAMAARILRLCREAVAAEPDLMDAAGTPIRPLVDQHLPELMRRHAAAAAIAPESELAAIDAELMEGIDRVKKAVEEALSCSAVARRSALKAQLGFLELRHPDPVPLLECISERQAA